MESIIYWVLTIVCAPLVAGALDWRVQRLNQFQQKYNASMADIIFMVDVSGSVSGSGFNIEKEFVTSLLSKISVQRDATRVAVVTFGVGVSKNIDYIDYKYNDKDKCTFTEEFAQVVHRYEGATNINDALKMSRSILDGAEQHRVLRGNVNTVAFLLTDGGWNRGGSPYGTAQDLRVGKHFVELFVVGIGRWLNRGQLDRIAGNRNNVIMADDFSDFSKLATRIRGDQVERLYRRIPDHTKCKQCDINAMCSCGTISGIYTCSCYEGYYGSGTVGRCTKCPRGTYKEYPSPDPCKKCPQFSTSHQVGSTSPHDCKCLPGYTGYPHTGNPCDPKKCSYINPVLKNGVIPDCGKYYKDTCTFVCNKNFHIANEVVTSTSRKLTCGADGIWDNAVPQCVPITCQSFQTPAHMKVKCEGNHLGHKCTFECKEGYILIGAKERTCQGDGQWSGNSQPFCKVITCPKLRPIENVNVYPVQCLSRATDYDNGCAFGCKSGFKFKSGDLKRTCTSKGTWSGQELVCTDQTPPTITCPKDITADANFNQAFLNITFNYPIVRDNSITGSDDITVTQTPSYVISPYEFPIGVTIVEYTASDAVGNSHSCRFRVTVLDREKPLFTYCPENIATEIDNKNDVMKTVFWEAPQYNDNSGEAQIIRASNSNPSNFSVGTVNEVVYEIKDASNNYASCKFLVKVDSKQCPEREPPVNGALSTRSSAIGKIYAVFCQNPYTFNGPRANAYICDPNGKWFTIPSMPTTFWPNCTEIQPQEGMGQRMKFFYYTGSCQQDEGVRALIAQKFVTLLDRVILRFEGGCASPDNTNLCQPENVIVRCGKTSNAFGAQDSVEIELDVNVHSKEDISKQTSRVQSVSQAIHSDSAAKSLQVITVGSSQLVFGRVENVGAITGVCLDGSVFDSVKVSRSSEKVGCVSCVAGRYFKTSTRNCTDCPRGTYSLRPGSLGCTACPAGTTTATAGVSNSTKCREPCKAGTRSKDGLAPCQECPVGYYQPSPFQSKCEKCPGQTTTLRGASKKLDSCKMLCPAGTYSSTGMEPCTPCDIGFYQSNKGQKQCTKCPEPLSTHSIGTTIQLMCKKISHCASSPCVNGGKCTDEWNSFKCTCPAGFSGDRCQEQRDECQNNPCYGDAVCVDGVNSFTCVCPENFYGEFCSERKVQCKANTCASNQATDCYETEDGPRCKCKPGFTGNYCEQSINECASSPCKNGAVCVDGHRGFECQCVHGYNGTLCQQNVDDCVNGACLNGGSCVDGLNSYTCQCPPGYAGHRCEVNVNECTANPCRNGATCVDKINGYQCKCLPSFYGQHCTQRKTANDFELVFDRKVQGYAEGNILSALEEFTIAFWLKVDKNEKDSGTILSYAIEQGDRVIDNALVIGDINNFMLNVMGEEVETGVSVADGVWHHVAIAWSGKTGAFNSYKDGVNVVSQTGFQKGVAIPGNGIFVLGQEQDEVGRNFSASEAFDGSMSQLNMWNYVKDGAEVLRMSSFRCDQQLGNVLGWTDFNQVSVAVKQTNTFCSVKNTKFMAWSNVARPSCNAVSAQCMSGKHMGIKELNLFKATCTAAGYHCSNSEQTQHDSTNTNRCPTDMKIRYECPFTPRTDCDASKCNNRGKCIDTSDSFICQCNDGFSGSQCQTELKCASVEPFVNGYSRGVNNQVIFSCKSGYQLVGASTVTCVQGRYNKPIPTCVDINECNVNNGNCNQLCVNTKGSFRCACANGYKMHAGVCVDTNECNRKNSCQQKCVNTAGSYKCSCSKGYTLSADRVSCQDLNECQTKQHNCQQLCSNKLSSFECLCRPGYKLTQDGITCQKVSCPGLSAPANGGVSRGFGYFGIQATFTCNSGYRLQGDVKTTCRADGKWSGLKPVCVEVQCASLPSPHNGMLTVHGSGLNSRYTFTCFSGHRLVGSSVLMCQMDGTWSGKQPTCVSSRCTPLRNPSNGVIVGSSTQLGATVIIKCDQGYMLNNKLEGYRTCQSDGLWSHGNTQCVKLSCGRPASLANGTVIGQSFGIDDIITYRCNPGFGLSGPPARKCLLNEEWSGVAPKCLYHSCGYPGSLKNGELVGSDYTFGSSVSYKCKANYRLDGSTSRTCQTTGAWSNALPKCQEIKCVAPTAPTNGEVQGSKLTVNSHVLFDCRPGYTLLGERLITCQSNGKWSVPFPTCAVGKCGSAKLVGPSGTITSPNFPNSYNTTEYCRWNIVMPVNQQAYVDVKTLKTVAPDDTLEIYDGVSKSLLTVLGGSLPRSIRVTSPSSELDVRFISSGKHTAAGFTANYGSTTCGGHITALGGTLSTPNYPSNYPDNVHCTWIINIPGERIKLNFENFDTEEYDELEIWSSLSVLSSGKKLGAWSGFRGSFIDVVSNEMMFVSFTSNDKYARRGFRATVKRKTGVTL